MSEEEGAEVVRSECQLEALRRPLSRGDGDPGIVDKNVQRGHQVPDTPRRLPDRDLGGQVDNHLVDYDVRILISHFARYGLDVGECPRG